MVDEPAELVIAPEAVAYVILKAREFNAKVDAWNDPGAIDENDDAEAILENMSNDPVRMEAAAFISRLNEDEQAELVAIAWIGRGTFDAEEFDEAVRTAREEHTNPAADYLLGLPLLADYLADGLYKLGYWIEDPDATDGEVI